MGLFVRYRKNKEIVQKTQPEIISESTSKTTHEENVAWKRYLDSIINKIREVGYHKYKLEEYYRKGLEQIKSLKASGSSDEEIMRWLDVFLYATAKNLMEADKERFNRNLDYIDQDESLSPAEKKEEKEELRRMFEYKHGLPINFESEIAAIMKKLEETGYRELKLVEFKEECDRILKQGKVEGISGLEILSKLKYFCSAKCDKYKKDEARLAREIEYLKQQQSNATKDINSAREEFYLNIGGSFNAMDMVENYLQQLEEKGYSKSLLEKTKQEICANIEGWKNERNSIIKFNIEKYFEQKIKEIDRDTARKENDIRFTKDTITSKSSLDFASVYGRKFIEDRINSQIGIIEAKFKIKYGHDCFDEIVEQIEKHIKTYGISRQTFEKMCEDIQKEKGVLSVEDIERTMAHIIRENNSYISVFLDNIEDTERFAKIFYDTDDTDMADTFIIEFLSRTGEDRKEFCKKVDKKYLDYLNNSREKVDMASLFEADVYASAYAKARAKSMDEFSNKLFDIENGGEFSKWLTSKRAEREVTTYGFAFKRRF